VLKGVKIPPAPGRITIRRPVKYSVDAVLAAIYVLLDTQKYGPITFIMGHLVKEQDKKMGDMNQLAHFDNARQSLSLASSIDEVKTIRDRAEMLRAYAKQAGESLDMQNQCAEIKLRAERRAGEILKEQDKNEGGRPPENQSHDATSYSKPPTLEDIGINKSQSSRWQQIAGVPEQKFEAYIEEKKASKEEITTAGILKMPHVSHNSGNNEWYTPKEYIEAARVVLGSIDLDPASSEVANSIVMAKRIYTIQDDGLTKDWCGSVWLNPPYASGFVQRFADKLVSEIVKGNTDAAIVLVNNATETRWFRVLVDTADAICFPTGRVRFWGRTAGAPLQGQAIIYFGDDTESFWEAFKHFGCVYGAYRAKLELAN